MISRKIDRLVQGEKYEFSIWYSQIIAIPENRSFKNSTIVLEENTNAGQQTIKCLTDWWNENGNIVKDARK